MNHKKRNSITITTTMEGETSIWQSEGELIRGDGTLIIQYPDYSGNTETDNRLEVFENGMHLVRSGAFNSDMTFEDQMMTAGDYSVMFYSSSIQVFTKSYKLTEENDRFVIDLNYQIYEARHEIADNSMKITINKVAS